MKKFSFGLLFVLLILGLASLGPDTPADDPQTSGESSEELETFVPSEKLTADSIVSFPVDI